MFMRNQLKRTAEWHDTRRHNGLQKVVAANVAQVYRKRRHETTRGAMQAKTRVPHDVDERVHIQLIHPAIITVITAN